MENGKSKKQTLFEASWEVCNMCGGIYTVITTKAQSMQQYYKNYFLIGPYLDHNLKKFEQLPPTQKLRKIFDVLAQQGIKCIYGKWHIDGKPNVILIDFKAATGKIPDIKKFMWEEYKVDSLFARWDFDEPVAWSWCVGEFIKEYMQQNTQEQPVVHLHEWLCGGALLNIKRDMPQIPCVFTTHATMLGRTISGSYHELYHVLDDIDPDQEAKTYNIRETHSMEKACAHAADVFTTVSEITALEAEKILGIKPDVITTNGMNTNDFPFYEDLSLLHKKSRDKMREFILYYFMPYYSIDVDDTLLIFSSGRYEYHNKGTDVFIKALRILNDRLKKEGYKRHVVAFFLIPAGTHGVRFEVLESKAIYNQLTERIQDECKNVQNLLRLNILELEQFKIDDILRKRFVREIKGLLQNVKKQGDPPLTTHNMNEGNDDNILHCLLENGLDNLEDDKVKVIDYPVYIKGDDGILNMTYTDMGAGFHRGIFHVMCC
jgi:glycogen(starch) synthase